MARSTVVLAAPQTELVAPAGLYGQRPSVSADGSWRAQRERVWRMTPRERIVRALELGAAMKAFVRRYAR